MRTLELLCLIPILAVIGGCNTIPKATYKEFNAKAPDLDGYQKFNLARSLVAVKISPQSDTSGLLPLGKAQRELSKNPGLATPVSISVTSTPVPDENSRFGIKDGGSKYFQSTEVKLTNYADSDLFQTLAVEVTDNTAKTFGEIAALLGASGGVPFSAKAMQDEESLAEVLNIDVSAELGKSSADLFQTFTKTFSLDDSRLIKNGKIRLTIEAVPNDALPRRSLNLEQARSLWFHSACRNAKLEVMADEKTAPRKEPQVVATKSFRISDPRALQVVALPIKGRITANPECGVKVETESKDMPDAIATLTAAIKAAKDAYDALKGKTAPSSGANPAAASIAEPATNSGK